MLCIVGASQTIQESTFHLFFAFSIFTFHFFSFSLHTSVGFPYKEAVVGCCDEVHPLAQVVDMPKSAFWCSICGCSLLLSLLFYCIILIVINNFHMIHQSIGAVNTIIRRPTDGKLIGYNTDCEASITAIEDALKGIDT